MIVSLIAAVDEKGGIGKSNTLPWHLRTDLKRFKRLTMNHHIVMGRKTYETIGRSLPGRRMVIITRNKSFLAKDGIIVHSIQQAISVAKKNHEDEVFIIGGGDIFTQTIGCADRIYLTLVRTDSNADVFFPKIDMDDWIETYTEEIPISDGDDFATVYKILERNINNGIDK